MAALAAVTMASELKLWPIDRLTPYAKNPRTHSPEQIKKLAGLIVEFGFTNPILIDQNQGILAGHGRLAAARSLGMAEVPVIELTHLSEAQRRAYIIADNKVALDAGWDEEVLLEELGNLHEDGFDLKLTGFDDRELKALLHDFPPPGTGNNDTMGGGGLGNPVVAYNIVFDDQAQQDVWYAHLRELRGDYPELETIGARITAFVRDKRGAR